MLWQIATAFNLICTGTLTDEGTSLASPVSYEYRVDLKQRRYCIDHCAESIPIHSYNNQSIVFERGDWGESSVNRESGRYSSRTLWTDEMVEGQTYVLVMEMQCERAVFTGLPLRKF